MKFSVALAAATTLAVAANAAPTDTLGTRAVGGHPDDAPHHPIGARQSTFAKAAGKLFNLGSGAKYMAGTNAWWLSHITNNAQVDGVFKTIADTGLKVVRVWGFGSTNTDPGQDVVWYQLLNSTGAYINYGANGLARMDYVVSSAEKHGIKLVLPLVNNWGDLGGIPSYNKAFGGDGKTWYTDAKSQTAYKEWVKVMVNRYKASPAIFAWQLGNEPRCNGCATTVITKWATDISKYIKSLDSEHMVSLGDEGWLTSKDGAGSSYPYQGGEGIDWVANLQIPTLDYGTYHLYPEHWGEENTWGSKWIQDHDKLGAKVNKPVVLEEYGGGPAGGHAAVEGPWQQTVLGLKNTSMSMFWQFGYAALKNYGDVYSIYPEDTDYATLAKKHAADMWAKKV